MKHLHQEFDAGPDDLVEVTLNGRANVMLLDPPNFDLYRKGGSFRYYGGLADVSPVRLMPSLERAVARRRGFGRLHRPRSC